MQVDESQPSSSAPNAFIDERVELFDFDRSPFTPERVEEILTRRSLMQDELFIDYVLRNAGIENPTRLFPPSSKETIRETLTAVNDANNPSIKLECIVYYLLSWWKGDSDDNFCENKRIPSGFAELTFAYYLFDSGDYVRATTTVCTPRIRPDDALKVMQTIHLCRTIDPAILIHRYVTMAKPNLDSHHAVREIYTRALARVSFVDAWLFQRSYANDQEDETRETLMVVILNTILMPVPLKQALTALIAFPLEPSEEELLLRYTLNAPPDIPEHSLAALQDLIIIRFAQAGQLVKAMKLNREFANEMARANESGRRRSGWLASQKMEERRQMLRDIMSALPKAHRKMLEAQMGDATGSLSQGSSFSGLEMSWEAVPAPKPTQSVPCSLPPTPASVTKLPPPTPARTDESQRVVLPNASPSTPAAAPTPIKTSNLGKGAKTPGRTARTPGRPTPASGIPTPSFTPVQTVSAVPAHLNLTPATPFTDRSGAPSPQSSFIARVGLGGVRDLSTNTSINGRGLGNVFDSPIGASSPIPNGTATPESVGGKNAFFDPSAREESPRGIILANVELTPASGKNKVERKRHRLSEVFPPLDLTMPDAEENGEMEADANWGTEEQQRGDADVDMDEEEEQIFAAANLRTSRSRTLNALAGLGASPSIATVTPRMWSPVPSVAGKRKREVEVTMDVTDPEPQTPVKGEPEPEPEPEEEAGEEEEQQEPKPEPAPVPEKKSRKMSGPRHIAVPTPRRSSRISKVPLALDLNSPTTDGGRSTTESLPSPRMPGAFLDEDEGQSQRPAMRTRSRHTRTLSGVVAAATGLTAVPEDAPLEGLSPTKPPTAAGRPKKKRINTALTGKGRSAEPSPVEAKRESDEESVGSGVLPKRVTRRSMAVPGGFTSSPPRSATPQGTTSTPTTKKRPVPARTISTRSRLAQ